MAVILSKIINHSNDYHVYQGITSRIQNAVTQDVMMNGGFEFLVPNPHLAIPLLVLASYKLWPLLTAMVPVSIAAMVLIA